MRIKLILIILTLTVILSCYEHKEIEYTTRTAFGLDTQIDIKIEKHKNSEKLLTDIFDLIKREEKKLSFYDPNSIVSNLNRTGYSRDRNLIELIIRCNKYSELTHGKFDITIAPIMRLWGWDNKDKTVPEPELIKKFLPLVNYRNIKLSPAKDEVKIMPGMEIDLGGIAKGYIVEIVKNFLIRNNVTSALINAGGDISIIGKKNNIEKWKIGIKDPFNSGDKYNCYLLLEDTSIATSGSYERYFIKDDKVYSHILNPETGYPEHFNKSVSVICNSLEMADALATGLFLIKPSDIMKIVNELPGVEAIVIDSENLYHLSKNIIPGTNFILENKNIKVIKYE